MDPREAKLIFQVSQDIRKKKFKNSKKKEKKKGTGKMGIKDRRDMMVTMKACRSLHGGLTKIRQ